MYIRFAWCEVRMKRRKKKRVHKVRDVRFYITLDLIYISLILLFTVYRVCEYRLGQAIRDVFLSLGYYFLFLFGIEGKIVPTVTQLPSVDIAHYLFFDLAEVQRKLEGLWSMLWDPENFFNYLIYLINLLNRSMIIGTLLLPAFCLLVYMIFSQYTERHVNALLKVPKRRNRFYRFLQRIFSGAKAFFSKIGLKLLFCFRVVCSYVEWLKTHKKMLYVLAVVWLMNTNLFTIALEAFAYYFYFVASFDFLSIGSQIVKLIYDLVIALWTLPGILWLIIGYIVFDLVRKHFAYKKLNHMEAKNRGFDNSLPVVTMACGSMGAGKTKTAVDISLSFQNEFRDRALELLDKNMLRFPDFDFHSFEKSLKQEIADRKILNLATARRYIREKRFEYGRHPEPSQIWGYDLRKHPKSYNNGLELVGIWICLENYAQEYFIYTMNTSLIISSLAIRCDLDPVDEGFFLSFNQDFFRRDPRKVDEYSCFSHIIDFDLFRIGCQMNKENAIAGSFEFGVIVVSEIGKERQNTLELRETKKNSTEANQKNDLFNSWLKMCRHEATVEGYSFIRFICDEQRPESWGADARDLCAILNIKKVSERRSALVFCLLPAFFLGVFIPKYFKFYNKVKRFGNENAPVIRKLHSIVGRIYGACERKDNIFGYYKETIAREVGTMDEEAEDHVYYLMPKKIYAGRYSTDCYKDLFAGRALEAGTSLYTIDTYKTACALIEELARQNSYFANEFLKMYSVIQE